MDGDVRTARKECAVGSTRTRVRDSKKVDGPVVTVAGSAWDAFLQALRSDKLAR